MPNASNFTAMPKGFEMKDLFSVRLTLDEMRYIHEVLSREKNDDGAKRLMGRLRVTARYASEDNAWMYVEPTPRSAPIRRHNEF